MTNYKSLKFQDWVIHNIPKDVLGSLEMGLPGDQTLHFGKMNSNPQASIRVRNEAFFRKVALAGDIGFGESYVDGDWETDDLTAVIEWMIINLRDVSVGPFKKWLTTILQIPRLKNLLNHRLRWNSISGSRKNIHAHYDLGNDFFGLFLDRSMSYSSAFFAHENSDLDQAQESKLRKLCEKLDLKSSDHVLDLGCGWGAFAIYAAKKYGCRITGTTISHEQYLYFKERVVRESLQDLIDVRLTDYRLLGGQFDKLASIEMIEAVGHQYLELFFEKCSALLKKGGRMVLQAILMPDIRYRKYIKDVDWIQKHIFPGGVLPSMGMIQRTVQRAGDLCLQGYEDMTHHYAKTLRHWRDRLNRVRNEWPLLSRPENFLRKWNYYFSYCEAGFLRNHIHLAQAVFGKESE